MNNKQVNTRPQRNPLKRERLILAGGLFCNFAMTIEFHDIECQTPIQAPADPPRLSYRLRFP